MDLNLESHSREMTGLAQNLICGIMASMVSIRTERLSSLLNRIVKCKTKSPGLKSSVHQRMSGCTCKTITQYLENMSQRREIHDSIVFGITGRAQEEGLRLLINIGARHWEEQMPGVSVLQYIKNAMVRVHLQFQDQARDHINLLRENPNLFLRVGLGFVSVVYSENSDCMKS